MGPDLIGVSAIAMALIGLITKIWLDSSNNSRDITNVVKDNAIAATQLKDAVRENTEITRQTKEAIVTVTEKIIRATKRSRRD